MKFDKTLETLVNADLESGNVVMLLGEPGIGKSEWTRAYARNRNTKCFILPCNQIADKADLTGARPAKDGNGKYKMVFFPHAVIADAIEYAEKNPTERPVLFMDELNRTTPDVTSEMLSIPTMRSIGGAKLPDNLQIITAGNDKGNITSLDEASVSRFVLYHVEPDVNTFLSLDPDLNPCIKRVLEKNPNLLFCKPGGEFVSEDDDSMVGVEELLDEEDGMRQFTTPRTISATSRWLNSLTNEDLLALMSQNIVVSGNETRTLLEESLISHLGETPFEIQLNLEITSSVNNVSSQQTAISAPKPRIWATVAAQTNRDSLDDMVDDLSDNDLAGCFLYALYDKNDNTQIVQSIASRMNRMIASGRVFTADIVSMDKLQTLLTLISQMKLNRVNVEALSREGGEVWNSSYQFFAPYTN